MKYRGEQQDLFGDRLDKPSDNSDAEAPGARAAAGGARRGRCGGVLGNVQRWPGGGKEHSPEHFPARGRSGWLEAYSVKRGCRIYRYWRYCWRDGFRGRTHRLHVKAHVLGRVRSAIALGLGVERIERIVRGRAKGAS